VWGGSRGFCEAGLYVCCGRGGGRSVWLGWFGKKKIGKSFRGGVERLKSGRLGIGPRFRSSSSFPGNVQSGADGEMGEGGQKTVPAWIPERSFDGTLANSGLTEIQPRSTFHLISSTGRTEIVTVSSLLWAWGMRVDDEDEDDDDGEGKDGKV